MTFVKHKRFINISYDAYETFNGIASCSSFDTIEEALSDLVDPSFFGYEINEIFDCLESQIVWTDEMTKNYIKDKRSRS